MFSHWVSSGVCFCTCGFHTGHICHHDPTQSVSHVWSLGLPSRKCSHHRLHTKSSEMKAVVHMMQQLSSCVGPSAVEHQGSKGCVDIPAIWIGCRWHIWGGGGIANFCILQPNSLSFRELFFLHNLRKSPPFFQLPIFVTIPVTFLLEGSYFVANL